MEEPLQSHGDATAAEEEVGGCSPLPSPLVSSGPGLQPPVRWHGLGPLPRWGLVRTCPSRGAVQPPPASLPPNYPSAPPHPGSAVERPRAHLPFGLPCSQPQNLLTAAPPARCQLLPPPLLLMLPFGFFQHPLPRPTRQDPSKKTLNNELDTVQRLRNVDFFILTSRCREPLLPDLQGLRRPWLVLL